MGRRGAPPKKTDIMDAAENLITKFKIETPFVNGRPGETWFKNFIKRHSELAVRKPERISKVRAAVSEDLIRNWFDELKLELESIGQFEMLNDPTRVFNTDETNIQLSPETDNVISISGWRNVYEVAPGQEKSTLTFLRTFSAAGENGKKPVILFVDGHKTHTSLNLSTFCQSNGIILYLLPPNTTHLLQPGDVGPFKSLKSRWRSIVHKFKMEHRYAMVERKFVAPMLDKVSKQIPRTAIINGFKASGLCPFNPDAVNYSKLIDRLDTIEDQQPSSITSSATSVEVSQNNQYKIALDVIEKEIDADVLKILKENNVEDSSFSQLCKLYNSIKRKSNVSDDTNALNSTIEIILNKGNSIVEEEVQVIISATDSGPSTSTNVSSAHSTSTTNVSSAPSPSTTNVSSAPSPSTTNVSSAPSPSTTNVSSAPSPSTTNVSSAPSTPITDPIELFANRNFYPGNIVMKKGKRLPKEKLPFNVSSTKYREYVELLKKNKKRPVKSKANNRKKLE